MRRIIVVLLAALAVTMVFTRTWWLPPKTLEVVLSGQSPYWFPFYLAREEGFFRREGLDVRVSVAASRGDLAAALNREPVVALAGPDVLLTSPSVMFARVGRLDPTFLLSREPGEFRWSSLQGSSIVGYPPGTEEQAVLETVLKKEGVRAQYQVTVLENIPPLLRIPAFLAGTGRFLQASEPTASLLEYRGQARVSAFPGAVAGDLPAGVFLASPAMVRDHPRELAAFTRAIYRSLVWLAHNPAPGRDAARYLPGVDPAVIAAALARYQKAGVWPASPVISRKVYRNWVNMMEEAGELNKPVPYERAVDPLPSLQALQTPLHKRWIWPALN
ncbi:MAG: ABC transporter substrate-binding protein [Peptococcaceae bacterium]|jgi:NitT/TauT family transport system substrate-binding protein|nr:ABC transporter substrate-binding protein [Peptococcaceae bacterium]